MKKGSASRKGTYAIARSEPQGSGQKLPAQQKLATREVPAQPQKMHGQASGKAIGK